MVMTTEESAKEEARTRELARIEDEVGCPAIGAGLELGANGAAYLGFVSQFGDGIDPERLKAFLRQELFRHPLFDEVDVDAIAEAALNVAGHRVQKKFVPTKQPAEVA